MDSIPESKLRMARPAVGSVRQMKRLGRFAWVAVGAACLALLPVPVAATVGTGVGASPITLAEPAQPGHSYRLPALYVINTGTESSYYMVRVQAIGQSQGKAVPASWIQFGRNHFQLQPKQALAVPITLAVPGNATTGTYRSYLAAGTVPASPTSGVAFGAAAATRLEFTVARPGGFTFPWPWPLWVWLLVVLLVLVGGGLLLLRASGLGIQIERRR
jgi:hypothetical protein